MKRLALPILLLAVSSVPAQEPPKAAAKPRPRPTLQYDSGEIRIPIPHADDPKVRALRSKVEVVRDESFSTVAAAVDIMTADGMAYKLAQPAARGSDANPLSDRDLEEKLRASAARWKPFCDARPLIDALWAVDSSEDVSNLASMTVP